MTVVCCKCKKIRIEGEWKRHSESPMDIVSHTYCPICLASARTELLPSTHGYTPRLLKQVPVFLNASSAEY